jgi:hypothetical protein
MNEEYKIKGGEMKVFNETNIVMVKKSKWTGKCVIASKANNDEINKKYKEYKGVVLFAYYTINKSWGGTGAVYKNEHYRVQCEDGRIRSFNIVKEYK